MSNYYGTLPPIIQLRALNISEDETVLMELNTANYAVNMNPPTYNKVEDRIITLAGEKKSILYGYNIILSISFKVTEEQTADFVRFYENLIAWEHRGDAGSFNWCDGQVCSDYHAPKIYVKPYADGTIDFFEATLTNYNMTNMDGLLFIKEVNLELQNKFLLTEPFNLYHGDAGG